MSEEYRYRFKGKDVKKNRRLIIEKVIDGKVVNTRAIPTAEKLWKKLDYKNVQKINR